MRTKWWKLKGDASQVFKDRVITERPRSTGEEVDSMSDEMSTHIRKVSMEVFGVSRENKHKSKDTWW
jgi:hypothetical protein